MFSRCLFLRYIFGKTVVKSAESVDNPDTVHIDSAHRTGSYRVGHYYLPLSAKQESHLLACVLPSRFLCGYRGESGSCRPDSATFCMLPYTVLITNLSEGRSPAESGQPPVSRLHDNIPKEFSRKILVRNRTGFNESSNKSSKDKRSKIARLFPIRSHVVPQRSGIIANSFKPVLS